MAERLNPPSFKEGFEKITVVRVKGQPGSQPVASDEAAGEEPVQAGLEHDPEAAE
jgi:hypothetical protein